MKRPLVIILVFFICYLPENIYSQKINESGIIILHDSLTQQRFRQIDLASLRGWKYSSTDNKAYSSSTYDDKTWKTFEEPLNEVEDLPDNWNGFGWFRLKVKVDSSFSTTESLISAMNTGGLQLYINDSLILHQGNPSVHEAKEILFGSSLSTGHVFHWEKGKTYQIAVKYSFHDFKAVQGFMQMNSPLNFSLAIYNIKDLKQLVLHSQRYAIVFASSSILLFLVMILHFILYKRAKDEEGNFWVFLLSFTIFISTFITLLQNNYDFPNFYISTFLFVAVNFAIVFSVSLIPLVAHKVLKVKYSSFWKYFLFLPILELILKVFIPKIGINEHFSLWFTLGLLFLAIFGGSIAVIKARKQKNKDVYLVAVPVLAFPILFVLGTFIFSTLGVERPLLELIMIFVLVTIIPLGFSIYQAKKFLRMHTHLDSMVEERTTELEQAMENLRQSHEDLKAAQKQLVQQEKLASLGQLTAGIAHEIKNPLNFVTNFSDVCLELIEEAKAETIAARKAMAVKVAKTVDTNPLDGLTELLENIEENLHKIFQHGNRADGIVKSMLSHSRGGSGKMEPTDLNKLVQEYTNLAYHGMRASQNPINVKIEFDLDEQVSKVSLIAEDFSRVILNLCSNAFDAMKERNGEKNYQAILRVGTQLRTNYVEISVEDNGTGINEDIIDKILQPFYTTKKGTEGTGLGLSLSYEIVKAQGGELKVQSPRGKGAKFIILLPVSQEENLKFRNN